MNPAFILSVLCLLVVVSELLAQRTALKSLGTALIVIVLTAIVANLGLIPTGSTEENPVPVYDGIFAYLAPLAIFWLLLRVSLKDILKAGVPLILLFLIGSFGTALGVVLGIWAINGKETLGGEYAAVGGMFAATYIGGSINFNAVALHYNIMRDGVLYSGAVAVDNIITTLWMAVTLIVPKVFFRAWKFKVQNQALMPYDEPEEDRDEETTGPLDLALTLGLGLGALALSKYLETLFPIPSVITLTLIALAIAQTAWAKSLRGPRSLGLISVYLFLAVIGAFCNIEALGKLGPLGFYLLALTSITMVVHGIVVLLGARIFRLDLDKAAIASQANVGGAASALALARSLGRSDLTLAAVLLGSLGNAMGTFIGFWVVNLVA